MGKQEKIVILIMAFCLCVTASSSTHSEENLPSDHLQGDAKDKAHLIKFSHASGSSHPEVICGGGGGGGGGSGSIPFAAGAGAGAGAGAANKPHNNHPNHNGTDSSHNFLGLVTFASTILACLLLGQKI